jgi:RNase P subunit RPR2
MSEFQQALIEYELKPTKQMERSTCQSCGEITIPGLNTAVRVIQKNRKERKKKQLKAKNLIEITCLTCSRVKLYHGSFKNKLQQKEEQVVIVKQEPEVKKKKNKGKNNNLKALLAKQQQDKKPNNNSSLLGDFLSCL